MRLTTKTEYGLVCLIHMARHPSADLVNLRQLVKLEHFSITYLQKIFQKLADSNIVSSQKGKQGGYALARDPARITLKEIIEALEGRTFDVFCTPQVRERIICNHLSLCGISPVWNKTKELLDTFYSSVTLAKLAEDPAKAVSQPIAAAS